MGCSLKADGKKKPKRGVALRYIAALSFPLYSSSSKAYKWTPSPPSVKISNVALKANWFPVKSRGEATKTDYVLSWWWKPWKKSSIGFETRPAAHWCLTSFLYHFTLKAKRSEYEATTWASYSKLSFPPASLNRLSLTPLAPAPTAHVPEDEKEQSVWEGEYELHFFLPPTVFLQVAPFRMRHQRPALQGIIGSISPDYSVQTSSKWRRLE